MAPNKTPVRGGPLPQYSARNKIDLIAVEVRERRVPLTREGVAATLGLEGLHGIADRTWVPRVDMDAIAKRTRLVRLLEPDRWAASQGVSKRVALDLPVVEGPPPERLHRRRRSTVNLKLHLLQHARVGGQPQRARRIRDCLHQSSSSLSIASPFIRGADADPHPVSADIHIGQREVVRK